MLEVYEMWSFSTIIYSVRCKIEDFVAKVINYFYRGFWNGK